MNQTVSFIGAALGWGAGKPAVERGPSALKATNQFNQWPFKECLSINAKASAIEAGTKTYDEKRAFVHDFNARLADATAALAQKQHLPVVVGGDHAVAMGTWQGLKAGLSIKTLGLLWVDAHLDAHTPETTPSQNIHGMPVATLLGYGDRDLATLKATTPTLDPAHIALVGIRSADPGETELLASLGVRIFDMQEIKARGIEAVMAEATEIVTTGTDAFGMSIDVDGFDPTYAPGTGTPEPGGLEPNTLIPILAKIATLPTFRALEIVEYNPEEDNAEGVTQKLVIDLIEQLIFQSA